MCPTESTEATGSIARGTGIDRLGAGDRTAFDGLVRALWGPVARFLSRRIPPQDVDDLAQNVFALVFRSVARGGGPGEATRLGWQRYVFQCARNQARDYYRRRRCLHPPLPLHELLNAGGDPLILETSVPEPCASLEEETAALRECLATLPAPLRSAFLLHFAEGKSKRETARLLGLPESSLRAHLARAIASLRACLAARGIRSPGESPGAAPGPVASPVPPPHRACMFSKTILWSFTHLPEIG